MFRRLPEARVAISIRVDGRIVEARAGDSVAAALLAAGIVRTRAPYCAMGACFGCLVAIDGVGNRRACMVPAADGMVIETHGARRDLAL
jgi:predicted molibdopterin-dependent oxidoreductase YjgC